MGTHECIFSVVFTKGYNFCNLLIASLDNNTFPKGVQLLKARICSSRSKLLPLSVDPH